MENGKFFNLNLKCFNRANSDNIAYLKEKPFTYTKSINQNMKDIYLEGYWQNERYFNDIKLLIKKEFTLKHQISHESLNLKKMMEDCNSVSIHVRKGDYVGNPFFKECSANYYKNAINYILNKVDTPHFFIFSDSIESLRNYNFPGKVTFVNNHSLRRDYEDLLLMSRCKHNIIANSTFSWWAAWLNDNKDKIVISPLNWYSKKRNNKLIKKYGLIPKAWITV